MKFIKLTIFRWTIWRHLAYLQYVTPTSVWFQNVFIPRNGNPTNNYCLFPSSPYQPPETSNPYSVYRCTYSTHVVLMELGNMQPFMPSLFHLAYFESSHDISTPLCFCSGRNKAAVADTTSGGCWVVHYVVSAFRSSQEENRASSKGEKMEVKGFLRDPCEQVMKEPRKFRTWRQMETKYT